jgi:hypothetical protein
MAHGPRILNQKLGHEMSSAQFLVARIAKPISLAETVETTRIDCMQYQRKNVYDFYAFIENQICATRWRRKVVEV